MNVTELTADSRTARRASHSPTAADSYLTIASGHAPLAEVSAHPSTRSTRSRIFIRRLQINARIGVYDWEKAALQPVVIDLEFGLASELACHTDRIGDAIDYSAVVERMRQLATARHYELVEAMAETMAMTVQQEFGVPWLNLTLSKLAPFPGAEVGIVVERGQRS
jgi:dihydroneopterin aldolase